MKFETPMILAGFVSMCIFTSLTVRAEVPEKSVPRVFECRAMIVADDLKGGGVEFPAYQVIRDGQTTHGGETRSFASGSHSLDVESDGRWLSLTWKQKGRTVAMSVVSLRVDQDPAAQALIAYDPSNQENQASVDCGLRAKK